MPRPQYAGANDDGGVPRVSRSSGITQSVTVVWDHAHGRQVASEESAEQRGAHVPHVSLGPVSAPAPSRVAQSGARILRLRRVGGDLSPFRPLLPLGDPPRRVDRVARGQLVS